MATVNPAYYVSPDHYFVFRVDGKKYTSIARALSDLPSNSTLQDKIYLVWKGYMQRYIYDAKFRDILHTVDLKLFHLLPEWEDRMYALDTLKKFQEYIKSVTLEKDVIVRYGLKDKYIDILDSYLRFMHYSSRGRFLEKALASRKYLFDILDDELERAETELVRDPGSDSDSDSDSEPAKEGEPAKEDEEPAKEGKPAKEDEPAKDSDEERAYHEFYDINIKSSVEDKLYFYRKIVETLRDMTKEERVVEYAAIGYSPSAKLSVDEKKKLLYKKVMNHVYSMREEALIDLVHTIFGEHKTTPMFQ